MKKTVFIFAVLFLSGINQARAVNMDSTRFRIESGNINVGGKSGSSNNFQLSTTLGQTAAGQFDSTGYIVKAGFQYIYSIVPFSFSLSSTSVNLGSLQPGTPSTQNITLTVDFGNSGSYQVTAEEIGKLRSSAGPTIADTSCNGGAETCTETSAKLWTSGSVYGFGYNMSGHDVPTDFSTSNHYRPFPDRSLSEAPAVIMTSSQVNTNRVSTVKFKTNVSTLQEPGTYQTVINFIATPSF